MTQSTDSSSSRLYFAPIDLSTTRDLCIEFRADSYICSFGSDAEFHTADGCGSGRYVQRLAEFMRRDPECCLHLIENERIIGQIEMGVIDPDAKHGHVFLFYIVPERRGEGFGKLLHDRALEYFEKREIKLVSLRVSETNPRAIRFYERLGWRMARRCERDPRLLEMEFPLRN